MVVIAFADVAFGHIMNYCMTHAKGGDTKCQYFGYAKMETDILLFGSSRCQYHYDPQIISDSLNMSCYNAGKNGLSIIYHYAKFTTALERYTPKVIVYDVTPKFDLKMENNYDSDLKQLRPYYTYGEIAGIVSDFDYSERFKNISSFYQFNYVFIKMVSDNSHPMREIMGNGFKPMDKQMELEYPVEQDIAYEEVDSIKLKYIEKLICHCQNKGINIVLAASPSYKKNTSILFEPIRQLCSLYNIPFMDYYTDTSFVQNKNFFYDSIHLNSKGAEKFSQRFAHDLKTIYYGSKKTEDIKL